MWQKLIILNCIEHVIEIYTLHSKHFNKYRNVQVLFALQDFIIETD